MELDKQTETQANIIA